MCGAAAACWLARLQRTAVEWDAAWKAWLASLLSSLPHAPFTPRPSVSLPLAACTGTTWHPVAALFVVPMAPTAPPWLPSSPLQLMWKKDDVKSEARTSKYRQEGNNNWVSEPGPLAASTIACPCACAALTSVLLLLAVSVLASKLVCLPPLGPPHPHASAALPAHPSHSCRSPLAPCPCPACPQFGHNYVLVGYDSSSQDDYKGKRGPCRAWRAYCACRACHACHAFDLPCTCWFRGGQMACRGGGGGEAPGTRLFIWVLRFIWVPMPFVLMRCVCR